MEDVLAGVVVIPCDASSATSALLESFASTVPRSGTAYFGTSGFAAAPKSVPVTVASELASCESTCVLKKDYEIQLNM